MIDIRDHGGIYSGKKGGGFDEDSLPDYAKKPAYMSYTNVAEPTLKRLILAGKPEYVRGSILITELGSSIDYSEMADSPRLMGANSDASLLFSRSDIFRLVGDSFKKMAISGLLPNQSYSILGISKDKELVVISINSSLGLLVNAGGGEYRYYNVMRDGKPVPNGYYGTWNNATDYFYFFENDSSVCNLYGDIMMFVKKGDYYESVLLYKGSPTTTYYLKKNKIFVMYGVKGEGDVLKKRVISYDDSGNFEVSDETPISHSRPTVPAVTSLSSDYNGGDKMPPECRTLTIGNKECFILGIRSTDATLSPTIIDCALYEVKGNILELLDYQPYDYKHKERAGFTMNGAVNSSYLEYLLAERRKVNRIGFLGLSFGKTVEGATPLTLDWTSDFSRKGINQFSKSYVAVEGIPRKQTVVVPSDKHSDIILNTIYPKNNLRGLSILNMHESRNTIYMIDGKIFFQDYFEGNKGFISFYDCRKELDISIGTSLFKLKWSGDRVTQIDHVPQK